MTDETFAGRLEQVEARIAAACDRAGRDRATVRMLAVSKKKPPEIVREAADAGVRVFGESRVQEAAAKIPMCPGHLSWHLVGHLQRNKVKRAIPLFEMIHSVDSFRLLETLHDECETAGRNMPVLIQVNVSGEPAKYGIEPDELDDLLETTMEFPRLDVMGLMTIPPWSEDVEKARPHFAALRELRDKTQEALHFPLPELSMGMSHDFEVAIEEGATWIRVGTALFGERKT